MEIPVLLEQVANNGYRATTTVPVSLSAEGATRQEAVAKLREQVMVRLQSGAELLTVDIPTGNPWLEMAGIFDAADPLIEDWKRSIAEYRREVESDPDYP